MASTHEVATTSKCVEIFSRVAQSFNLTLRTSLYFMPKYFGESNRHTEETIWVKNDVIQHRFDLKAKWSWERAKCEMREGKSHPMLGRSWIEDAAIVAEMSILSNMPNRKGSPLQHVNYWKPSKADTTFLDEIEDGCTDWSILRWEPLECNSGFLARTEYVLYMSWAFNFNVRCFILFVGVSNEWEHERNIFHFMKYFYKTPRKLIGSEAFGVDQAFWTSIKLEEWESSSWKWCKKLGKLRIIKIMATL